MQVLFTLRKVEGNEMEIEIDKQYIMSSMEEIINTPSPVGYYEECEPLLERYFSELGLKPTYDNRHTAYVTLEGTDDSRKVCIGAHVDTLGLVVHHIEKDGSMKVKNLGGNNMHSLEHEKMYLITLDGRKYTGYMTCVSHSVHVFNDAKTLERDEDTMRFLLDEEVHSDEDVKKLGIRHGDVIAAEPHFEYCENGRIRSRFIDDKAAVAAALAAIKYLKENHLTPKYTTVFAFPYYEELGFGASYIPDDIDEYIGLDIGVIGPEHSGTERTVSIVAKDAKGPYDRALTKKLVRLAEKIGIDYSVEVFNRYSTDAMAGFIGGNDIAAAAFGMTVYTSHGVERTFDSSVFDTAKLTVAYALDL